MHHLTDQLKQTAEHKGTIIRAYFPCLLSHRSYELELYDVGQTLNDHPYLKNDVKQEY